MVRINEEVAKQEFERWFDSKKLSSTKRKNDFEAVESEMVSAIADGYLVVNEDFTLTLKLAWSLTQPSEINELKFAYRIPTGVLQSAMSSARDQSSKLIATIATLTGQSNGIIRALDPVDYGRAAVIAAYFF